jgi:hypothetical protein
MTEFSLLAVREAVGNSRWPFMKMTLSVLLSFGVAASPNAAELRIGIIG